MKIVIGLVIWLRIGCTLVVPIARFGGIGKIETDDLDDEEYAVWLSQNKKP